MGKYPALAVEVMGRIVTQAENDAFEMDAYAGISYEIDNNDTTNAVCDATCTTARDISAKAIIAVTKSGQTARRMSKFRPVQPIVAATPVEKTFHQLALSWAYSRYWHVCRAAATNCCCTPSTAPSRSTRWKTAISWSSLRAFRWIRPAART